MKALIQRVSKASVKVDNKTIGQITKGFTVMLGITHNDTEKEAFFIADKIANLRVFEDNNGKMNLSLKDVDGSALIISQFTLYGDARKGRRPSFTEAARPEKAIPLYELLIKEVEKQGIPVATGEFGAHMDVEIHNSGPVTIMVEKENC
ncbi:MAG: D-tyrosyl-tRNA(Tyr) deacylase [bacterium]|nr:D-tyrosyl-tRNA(Tyr) deacylase [bacterium]